MCIRVKNGESAMWNTTIDWWRRLVGNFLFFDISMDMSFDYCVWCGGSGQIVFGIHIY